MVHIMRFGEFGKHIITLANDWLAGRKDLIGIEIGCYAGESTQALVNSGAFKKFYCIDPWEMGYDPADIAGDEHIFEAEQVFDSRFKDNPAVIKIKKKSHDAVGMFEDESIDFIYIDGNHQYQAVKQDLEDYVPKIKQGGIIAGHDYLYKPMPGVTKAVDEFFGKPPHKYYPDNSWVQIKGTN